VVVLAPRAWRDAVLGARDAHLPRTRRRSHERLTVASYLRRTNVATPERARREAPDGAPNGPDSDAPPRDGYALAALPVITMS
jgi:hypothetical protein